MIRSFNNKATKKLYEGLPVVKWKPFSKQAQKRLQILDEDLLYLEKRRAPQCRNRGLPLGENMVNKMRPIHPGEILKDELDELELSANAFAKLISVPTNRITSILNGKRSITADTALRLSLFFGTSAEFWLNLQSAYDLKTTLKKSGKKIEKEVQPHHEAA